MKINLFKRKNDNFLKGNNNRFLFEKIDTKVSVINIVKTISKSLLAKNLNLKKNKSLLVEAKFLLKRSNIVLTSLQQVFRP